MMDPSLVAEASARTTTPRFVKLTNPPLPFIGIQLLSIATIGIQQLKNTDAADSGYFYPELQFTLLTTSFKAEGLRPLVWLFYKLIGGPENATASCLPSNNARFTTFGFTRVWAEPTKDGVIFCNCARLASQIAFPSFLIAALPFTVDQMEAQGTSTLQNAIEKDIGPAMLRFQTAYMEWLDE